MVIVLNTLKKTNFKVAEQITRQGNRYKAEHSTQINSLSLQA